jgi:Zn-dependent peptidase ImmA (M78 family)
MSDRIESIVNPELIAWARRSAGLSVADAARKIQVSEARVEEWERGVRKPTVTQLGNLADAYRRPLGVFYLPTPPEDERTPPDFRRFDIASDASLSPELRLAIRTARFKRQAALDLLEEAGQTAPQFPGSARPDQSPEDVAAHLRRAIGNGKLPTPADARLFFNHWRSALESLGVLVFQASKIELDEMRGFSITERPLPVVVVNIKDAFTARSFSLFHEAAHVLLGRDGLCNFEENGSSNQAQRLEAFCNHVSGATLVPRDALLRLSETPKQQVSDLPDDVTASIARRFGVSQEVILRRLVTVGRLAMPFYLKKRDELRRRPPPPARDSGFAPPSTMAVATNGRLFTRLVLDAYADEKIGTSDVLELLGVRAKHVDAIRNSLQQTPTEESVET